METILPHRAPFRAANASLLVGLLSGILFFIFYSTDLKPYLLVAHLLGIGAFALGVDALTQVPATRGWERARAVAGMLFGMAHAAVLGLLFCMAAAG